MLPPDPGTYAWFPPFRCHSAIAVLPLPFCRSFVSLPFFRSIAAVAFVHENGIAGNVFPYT